MSLSALNLYFKPSVYEAKAVIKVKTQEGKGENSNTIDKSICIQGPENIDQDLGNSPRHTHLP